MKPAKLRRKILRQAKSDLRRGDISLTQYGQVTAVCNDNETLEKINFKIENEVNPWNRADGLIGLDWSGMWANIWDWFVANWPQILKIILTFAPLLLMEKQKDADS